MSPVSDPVVTPRAVVPRPIYPPLPTAPVPRLTNRTPPPGPDIRVIVPDAPAQVQALNKIEAESPEPVPFADLSGGGDFDPDWRLYDLFLAPPRPVADPKSWPPADAFTLYLMAILDRFTYQPASDLRDQARDAILSVLGGGYSLTIVTDPALPQVRYDLWRYPGSSQIIAIQGTTSYAEWIQSIAPTFQSITGLSTDKMGYIGIVTNAMLYSSLLRSEGSGLGASGIPTIMTGHSLGGAIAQLMSGVMNAAYRAANPTLTSRYPVVSQYTFGAPAWASDDGVSIPNGWLDAHVRCYLPADPIPYATQVAISRLQGVGKSIQLMSNQKVPGSVRTRHYANKSIELAVLGTTARSRARNNIWMSLVDAGARLTQTLIDAHTMSSYTAACYQRCIDHRQTPAGKFDSLVLADRLMDRADQNAAQ